MEWHRKPEDIPLCNSCRVLGELAREMGLEADLSICDWTVTMQTELPDKTVEIRSACGKDLVPTELMRTQNLSKMAANTAGEARDKALGLGEALGEDQTKVQKMLALIADLIVSPRQIERIVEAEIEPERQINEASERFGEESCGD